MNVTESIAVQNVAAFLKGDVDHCDDTTRLAIAEDIALLQARASKALLGAGEHVDAATWDERLCSITFEAS